VSLTLRSKTLAAVTVLALTVAACGSDKKSSSTTVAPATSAAATTVASGDTTATTTGGTTGGSTATTSAGSTATTTAGSTPASSGKLPHLTGDQKAKITVITDVTQGQIAYSAPEAYPAAQAALSGFPNVALSVCDAAGDPNKYLDCQRKAVSDGDQAVIIGYSLGGQGGEYVLYNAGIPVIGGGGATNKLAYAFTSGTGNYVGLGAGTASEGCKNIGILYLDGTDFLVDAIMQGAKAYGAKEAARAAVASTAPDLAPAIAKLTGAKADCIILSVGPPMVVQAMTAINQSGEHPKVAAVGAILPPAILSAIGPLSDGIIDVEAALSAGDTAPVLTELKTAMAKFDAKAPVTVQSTLAFVSGNAVAAALATIKGDVTSASIVTALDSLKDVDMGGIVPPATIQTLKSQTVPRYMNPWALTYVIKDGKPVRSSKDFIDLKPAIEA
jgi:hypothetical protein